MIGGRKTRSNKGKKRTPYGPRTGVTQSKRKFRVKLQTLNKSKNSRNVLNNLSNVTNNAPVIKAGTNIRQTFNTINKPKRNRKVRSNKGKKRKPYGPRTGLTRSKRKFRGKKFVNPSQNNLNSWNGNWNSSK